MVENHPKLDPAGAHEKPRLRRWYQYSLRSLLGTAIVVGLAMTWLVAQKRNADRQRAVVESILEGGGSVRYDYQYDESGDEITSAEPPQPPGPHWLRRLLGDDFFANVVYADIPSGIKDVDALTHLRLALTNDRRFSDADLKPLGSLTKLEMLEVGDFSQITDTGMAYLGDLRSLRFLGLDNTRITDAGLKHLANLDRIQDLSLLGTRVSDLRPLEKMTGLKKLDLIGTLVDDASLKTLAHFGRLEELGLTYTQVHGEGLSRLTSCRNLRLLSLGSTLITDTCLKHIAAVSQLESLYLERTAVTDKGIDSLCRLSNLRRLALTDDDVTDAGLKKLSVLTHLQDLQVDGTKVTPHGISEFRCAVPKCGVSWTPRR